MPRYGQADLIWGSRELPHGAVLRKDPRGGGRDAGSGYAARARVTWAPGDARPSTLFPSPIYKSETSRILSQGRCNPLKKKRPPEAIWPRRVPSVFARSKPSPLHLD